MGGLISFKLRTSGGDAFFLDDAAGIREALAAFRSAAERLISAVRTTGALADRVANLGFLDRIADTNNHQRTSRIDS